jgi:hypothetical protein
MSGAARTPLTSKAEHSRTSDRIGSGVARRDRRWPTSVANPCGAESPTALSPCTRHPAPGLRASDGRHGLTREHDGPLSIRWSDWFVIVSTSTSLSLRVSGVAVVVARNTNLLCLRPGVRRAPESGRVADACFAEQEACRALAARRGACMWAVGRTTHEAPSLGRDAVRTNYRPQRPETHQRPPPAVRPGDVAPGRTPCRWKDSGQTVRRTRISASPGTCAAPCRASLPALPRTRATRGPCVPRSGGSARPG